MEKTIFNPRIYIPTYIFIHLILISYYIFNNDTVKNSIIFEKIVISAFVLLGAFCNFLFLEYSYNLFVCYKTKTKIIIIVFLFFIMIISNNVMLLYNKNNFIIAICVCISTLLFPIIMNMIAGMVSNKSPKAEIFLRCFGLIEAAAADIVAIVNLYITIVKQY